MSPQSEELLGVGAGEVFVECISQDQRVTAGGILNRIREPKMEILGIIEIPVDRTEASEMNVPSVAVCGPCRCCVRRGRFAKGRPMR